MEEVRMNESQQQVDIAIGSIPAQNTWETLIPPSEALLIGTIFKELQKPFYLGGDGGGR